MTDVEQRLREIEERVSKATPGPWEAYGVGGIHMDGTSDGYSVMTAAGKRLHSPYMTQADADFIAHAREDVPWLLSLLREREEQARQLGVQMERYLDALVEIRDYAWDRGDPSPDAEHMLELADAALRGEQP
ncbi:MAG: hypothetical protein CW346_15230 [Bacillaceae bacterium]|nr:hypothetical protein [Bacillaceae bacterium]